MERLLHRFESLVPPPQRITDDLGSVFRYKEKTLHQAIVQKLARLIEALRASHLLLTAGFLQEHGAIKRMIDEFNEDIAFLAFAAVDGEISELHQRYLDNFYEEEFVDPSNPLQSPQKRPMLSRQKVRAYISNRPEQGSDPSTGNALLRTVDKAYSGYIHGASPHIMEMYGGLPPRFHTNGMRGTPLFYDHVHDAWNYTYRGLISFGLAAKAFGSAELTEVAMAMICRFEPAHLAAR